MSEAITHDYEHFQNGNSTPNDGHKYGEHSDCIRPSRDYCTRKA